MHLEYHIVISVFLLQVTGPRLEPQPPPHPDLPRRNLRQQHGRDAVQEGGL